MLREINWLGYPEEHQDPYKITVKIRSSQEPVPAVLHLTQDDQGYVMLDQPEYGVSKGQACVFYDHTRVLGGGWIYDSK